MVLLPLSTCGRFIKGSRVRRCLIVRGELSDLLSAAAAQAMVEAIPDAELVTVPGVGHAPELNEPEAIAAIDLLLAKVASTG